jgi:hypothetical protein
MIALRMDDHDVDDGTWSREKSSFTLRCCGNNLRQQLVVKASFFRILNLFPADLINASHRGLFIYHRDRRGANLDSI